MELTARIINRTGDWYKVWSLQDSSRKAYGRMVYNGHRVAYTVEIFSPVHEELGNIGCKEFKVRNEALTWARKVIEDLPEPTIPNYEAAIQLVKDSRYQDEMADDFAYSNGKIARWDRIERALMNRMHALVG
jgi:hypothetical protein